MSTKIELEQIIDLLEKGFDPELIACELDLSINYIEACQKEYNKRLEYARKSQVKVKETERTQNEGNTLSDNQGKGKQKSSIENKIERNTSYKYLGYSYDYKAEQMRKKYRNLTSSNTTSEKMDKIPQDREKIEQIDAYIELIEQIINEIESKGLIDRKRDITKIIGIIEKLKDYQLSIGQAEKIIMLLSNDKLIEINYNSNDMSKNQIKDITFQLRKFNAKIALIKQVIELKLLNAIETEVDQADNLDLLNALSSKLTMKFKKNNLQKISDISKKINKKISLLQQRLCITPKVNIPSYVREIAESISKDEFNYEGAIAIIEENAQKEFDNRALNRFTLSKEQQKEKIIAQIRQVLVNNAEEYFILNPQRAIDNLSKLQDGEEYSAINTIVRNLAKRGCIEEANQICDKYRRDSQYYKDMKILKRIILEEEIKHFVLDFLNKSSTTSQQNKQFVNELDSKLQTGKVDVTSIVLGQNPITFKNVTLKDVYDYIPAKSER